MLPFTLIITGIINTSFCFFLYIKNPRRFINVSFALISLTLGIWTLCHAVVVLSSTYQSALLWTRLIMFGPIFTPALFHLFALAFPSRDSKLPRPLVIFYLVLIGIFLSQLLSPTLIKDVEIKEWGVLYKSGPLYIVYSIYFFITMVISILIFVGKYKRFKGKQKTQVAYILLGTTLSIIWGLLVSILLPLLGYGELNRYGPIGTLFIVVSFSYAIAKHNLMDIKVVIRRTLVFAGLLTFVYAVYGIAAFLVRNVAHLSSDAWTYAVSLPLIVLGYDRIRNLLLELTDRYLFQKKSEFRITLNQLGENITQTLDLDEGAQIILSTLRESLRLESGAIVMKDESDNGYYILDSFNTKTTRAYYESDSLLIKYLLGRKSMKKSAEHHQFINLEDPAIKGKVPTLALARLEELNAAICIPLFIKEDLIGFITLGKKKSDEEFTQQEMGYFPSLTSQIATALSKARTYDILRKSQLEFIQQEKLAALGTLSAGINHDIKNPLNNIKCVIEMHEMNDEAGFFASHSKEDYKAECKKIFESIKEDSERIDDIAKGLAEYVHQGDAEFKSQPVDLEKEVEGAYRLLKSQIQHNVIEFVKDFPLDLPKVSGDARRINEVLVNIINNARQAIKQNGTIKVVARKKQDTVELNIVDDGPGMNEEIRKKIFDPFFTTKVQGEGTGMGLYICREIVKRMKAKISVKSEVGKGTTFSIEFLIATEQGP